MTLATVKVSSCVSFVGLQCPDSQLNIILVFLWSHFHMTYILSRDLLLRQTAQHNVGASTNQLKAWAGTESTFSPSRRDATSRLLTSPQFLLSWITSKLPLPLNTWTSLYPTSLLIHVGLTEFPESCELKAKPLKLSSSLSLSVLATAT